MKSITSFFIVAFLFIQGAAIQQAWAQQTAQKDSYAKVCFYQAKETLDSMLAGKTLPNYEKAVFVTENAYWGNRESYSIFDYEIKYNIKKIEAIAQTLKANDTSKIRLRYFTDTKTKKNQQHDELIKNCAIYTYMTSPVYNLHGNILECHAPYTYSKNDPYGTIAWNNTQVLNLLTDQPGNCYALAALFKIYADKLSTDAVLATTSGHAFIQHNNDDGTMFNVELASHAFPGFGSIETLTYTTEKAIKSSIAMRSLNNLQAINLCLVYLAKGYENKFLAKDDDFILDCAELALRYDSLNLNAMLLKAEVLEARLLEQHKQVVELQYSSLFRQYEKLIQQLFDLGYREMPIDMQNVLLSRLKQEEYGTIANHTPQPFKDLKINNPRYATLSGGLFEEEIHDKPVERYHKTLFDTKTRRISAFTSIDSTYDNYITDPVVFAWSVDPDNSAYPGLSPYNGLGDNPITNIDWQGKLILYFAGFNSSDEGNSAIRMPTYWDIQLMLNAANHYNDANVMFVEGGVHLDEGPLTSTAESREWSAALSPDLVNYAYAISRELAEERKTNPNAKINIIAHSMGVAYSTAFIESLTHVKGPDGNNLLSSSDFGDWNAIAPYQPMQIGIPDVIQSQNSYEWEAKSGFPEFLDRFYGGKGQILGVPGANYHPDYGAGHGNSNFSGVFGTQGRSITTLFDRTPYPNTYQGYRAPDKQPSSDNNSGGDNSGGSAPSGGSRPMFDCFVAGTKVTMGNGSVKNIENIQVGDTVKTINITNLEVSNSRVYKIAAPIHDSLITVTFQDGVSNTNTPDHPYFVKSKGWCSFKPELTKKRYNISALQLSAGDIAYQYFNSAVKEIKIISVTVLQQENTPTYNIFTQGNNANYLANGILVNDEEYFTEGQFQYQNAAFTHQVTEK